MWNLKKGHDELRGTDTELTNFEKLMVSKGDRLGVGGGRGVWDGNAIKWSCDDHCTTINVIKLIMLREKKEMQYNRFFLFFSPAMPAA